MKKILFIDNDKKEEANKIVNMFLVPFFEAYGGIEIDGSTVEILPELYKCDKDTLYKKFYSGNYVIVSQSAFTIAPGFYNSKDQLVGFLRTAGTSEVKDIIYIDISGYLEKTISEIIKYGENKKTYEIMWAIENNFIVTMDGGKFHRIRIDFSTTTGVRKDLATLANIQE